MLATGKYIKHITRGLGVIEPILFSLFSRWVTVWSS